VTQKDYWIKIGNHYIVAGKEKALKTSDEPQAFTIEILPSKISAESVKNRKFTDELLSKKYFDERDSRNISEIAGETNTIRKAFFIKTDEEENDQCEMLSSI
jgi:hypothetical protein